MTAAPLPLPTAQHLRLEREHSFILGLPPADALGFFEPIGEKRWAEDWQPVFATPADAQLHDGSVFTVSRPHPAGSAPVDSVWTVTRYEPPRTIEYRNVLAGLRATRISVRCEATTDRHTRVIVRYVYTGLSEVGDAAIAEVTETAFAKSIEGWGQAIAAYLRRGTPASS